MKPQADSFVRYEDAEQLALSFNTLHMEQWHKGEECENKPGLVESEASTGNLILKENEDTNDSTREASNVQALQESECPSSKHPKSIAPPFHEKLSIENRLARVSDSCLLHLHQPWKLRVQLYEARGIRWKDGMQQAVCCFSSIEASAKISSQSFQSIYHVAEGGISLKNSSLCIEAACSSSRVEAGRDITRWNEIVELDHVQIFGNSDPDREFDASRKREESIYCLHN
eukprot:762422-Hanusia_phi.AAC.3